MMGLNLGNGLDPRQEISSPLAFVFLMILSTVVAWVTVVKAQEVINGAQQSDAISINNRLIINDLKDK
jgi:hypothetical protein